MSELDFKALEVLPRANGLSLLRSYPLICGYVWRTGRMPLADGYAKKAWQADKRIDEPLRYLNECYDEHIYHPFAVAPPAPRAECHIRQIYCLQDYLNGISNNLTSAPFAADKRFHPAFSIQAGAYAQQQEAHLRALLDENERLKKTLASQERAGA